MTCAYESHWDTLIRIHNVSWDVSLDMYRVMYCMSPGIHIVLWHVHQDTHHIVTHISEYILHYRDMYSDMCIAISISLWHVYLDTYYIGICINKYQHTYCIIAFFKGYGSHRDVYRDKYLMARLLPIHITTFDDITSSQTLKLGFRSAQYKPMSNLICCPSIYTLRIRLLLMLSRADFTIK